MTAIRIAAVLTALVVAGCKQPAAEPNPRSIAAATTAETQPMTPDPDPETETDPDPESDRAVAAIALETATFGAGCFWCIEAVLERLDGVREVESGYRGGHTDDPSYKAVCEETTGHAEVVQVKFDPRRIRYAELVDAFFKLHDPTTLNRQGNDVGTQYRSAIFFHGEAQHAAAIAGVDRWQPSYPNPIVTEITAAGRFWPAEGYHQDYFAKNPTDGYCNYFIPPKLKKLGLDGDGRK